MLHPHPGSMSRYRIMDTNILFTIRGMASYANNFVKERISRRVENILTLCSGLASNMVYKNYFSSPYSQI